ncbi:GPI-anchored cell wall organization protein Ecm33 [Polyplosphaeria fusca]|uniref:GPI-anchored cell wall organization protein Ecm33 n=1 Tax=Polyplosphaeria fusca TaxID=682080 RepID=A0A9P4RBW4_9PLEO|nr:GPI-anchored cell wall organization protein Ecm33 [Polyplosphaeria fusca]
MSPAMNIVLPILAIASTAYASCSVSGTTTIQNAGDATQLATCTNTFSGSIAIETGAAGPIALDGIKKIDGDLVITNNSIIQILSGDSLEEITGTFKLDTVQVLNTVNFPKLKTVNEIIWNALANLQATQFDAEITKVSNLDIQNTQLQSLEGINLESVDKVTIANNRYISSIIMQLGNVTNALTLEANNPEVNVSFPNLEWAFNLTFRNCSSVQVPSLATLNGSMGLYGNTFEDFSAPNLTKIGGALAFASNTELTNITLPELTEVTGALQIANNTKLSEINGIPKLKTIGGALDFHGNMSDVELPALNDVKGAFNLQSTGDIQKACDDSFQPLKDKGKIQGNFVCKGSVANPGGEGSTPTVTGAGAKKTGAASALSIDTNALGLVGLAAAFLL